MTPAYTFTRSLALFGLAASFVACGVSGSHDTADPQQIGEAAQPSTAQLDPVCSSSGYEVRHNSGWPWHAPGSCPIHDEYTLDDAAVACGGGAARYFSYNCVDHPDGSHTWTSYFACCAPAPVGADCTDDSQCASGFCGGGIGFETRYFAPWSASPPQSAAEAINLFESLPASSPGYGYTALASTQSYSNQTSIPLGDSTNFGSHLRARISVAPGQEGTWSFRLGPDFGLGGVLLVDRQEPVHDETHLVHYWVSPGSDWNVQGIHWGGTFSDPSLHFEGSVYLGPGLHDVEAYGFENCCDSVMELDAAPPGGTYQPISALAKSQCSPSTGLGAACTADSQCGSGHCVDGVCCDQACEGTCTACTAAKKGSGVDGTCEPVALGHDPDDECPRYAMHLCSHPGGCDGAGACRLGAAGSLCYDSAWYWCDGGGNWLLPICDGQGSCDSGHVAYSCGHYNCSGVLNCFTSCTSNAMCATGYTCVNGECQ